MSNNIELIEQWADYLIEHPLELKKVCDRVYALLNEDLWNQQERTGQWIHRL